MNGQGSFSNKALYVLIALLFVILTIQTFFLIRLAYQQEPNDHKRAVRSQPAQASYLHSRPPQTAQPLPPGGQRRTPAYARSFFDADPWEEMDAMMDQMRGMMRHAFTFGSPILQGMTGAEHALEYTPAIDLEETPEAYIVKSDLPGLQKDKINLTVRNGMLTIEGVREVSSEKKDDDAGFYAQERSYGSFARSLPLPGPVDESKVTAQYQDGVLVITLPKAKESAEPQKVVVQ